MSESKKTGRPHKSIRKLDGGKRISVILDADGLQTLDRIKRQRGMTTTRVVENALREYGKRVP